MKTYRRFPKVFWVSMSFELFERGAYYSFTPIIALHAWANVGAPLWLSAMIFTFIWPIQYGLPILSGALVEKVGYRRQMLVAFILLTAAYAMLARASNTVSLILAVVALGFGIGSYKPLISAIVAKVTTSEDRTYAFGIYYIVVNMAAAFFPVGFYIMEVQGYIHLGVYNIIFAVGAVLISFNIFIALFLFEDIPSSDKVKTVRDALNNVKVSMQDRKFMVLVLLVAGFWALYSTQLTGVIIIFYGYRWNPWWFTAILYAVFNPMTIVVAGPFISKLIEKVESIRVMIAGMMIYIVGLFVLSYGIADWRQLIAGLVIMSIGEFMVAPGFYSFTSKLATEDKVSAYIGSTFVASFLGLALGSTILGAFVAYVAETLQMPYFFFGVCLSVSLLIFIGFLIYYQKWGHDVIERTRRIAEEEEGKKSYDESYVEPFIFRLYETKMPIVISLIMIPIVLFSTFSLGTYTFYGPPDTDGDDEEELPYFYPIDYPRILTGSSEESETLNEGSTQTYVFEITKAEEGVGSSGDMSLTLGPDQLLKSISVSVTWQDEPSPVGRTNTPDVFELNVTHSGGWSKAIMAQNSQNEERTITITYGPINHELVNSTIGEGEWDIEVTMLNAGLHVFGPRDREIPNSDTGNAYTLKVSTEVYAKETA
jgi:MFS family permease